MKKIYTFTFLIVLGFIFSQSILGLNAKSYEAVNIFIKFLSMTFLSFIAVHVGLEFNLEKNKLRSYGWDGFVAFTTATIPWIFCALYIIYGMEHNVDYPRSEIWKEGLLLARFAAPTSVGVLLSMLVAVGLGGSWMYRKARTLAIFDDLDTIILMIPLKKVLFYGFEWDIALFLLVLCLMIFYAWKKMHTISLPLNWRWILFYSLVITLICELLYVVTDAMHGVTSLSLEVLFPAFLLGILLTPPDGDPEKVHPFFDRPEETRARFITSSLFMFFVGASMPPVLYLEQLHLPFNGVEVMVGETLWHVFMLTILSNLGKLFPMFCYRKEATLRERIALAIGMCPRGEIGAGVLVVSMGMLSVVEEKVVIVVMLTLALNLLLSGPFVLSIQRILASTTPTQKPL